MTNDLKSFKEFMNAREQAASAYVTGDFEPLGKIVAEESSATFFGPNGGFVQGTEEVADRYEKDAGSFAPGGASHFDVLDEAASDGIAYWTGFQRAKTYFKGKPDAIPFDLRVTEVFRREGDDWKLVHRHADPLAAESNGKK